MNKVKEKKVGYVMKIGYARVSTDQQSNDSQIDELKRAGCERIFQDTASGLKTSRPALDEMESILREGDVVVIFKLDRLGRSMKHLLTVVDEWTKKRIHLVSLHDGIDTTSVQGRLIFGVFAAFAEFERNLISERTKVGLKAARQRGRLGGRPKGMSQKEKEVKDAAVVLYQSKSMSVSMISKHLGISKATLYKYLRNQGVPIGSYGKK